MDFLLVSQAYPPYPIVGAQRAARVAETLRGRGHRVFIITERLAGEYDALRVDEPDFKVHTVPLKPQYRLRVVGALKMISRTWTGRGRAQPSGEGAISTAAPERSRPGLLKRAFLSLLWLPDDELRFVGPALAVARRIMRDNPIQVVYTTSPPHSSHLVGLWLRGTSDARWIAEFRDPWTSHRTPELIMHWFGPVEAVHRWLEQRCLRAADRVVTVTEPVRELLAASLPERDRAKVSVVLNGIADLQPAPRRPAEGAPFRILHAGTFYLGRDPRPFLRALAALLQRERLGPEQLRVDFVGRCRSFGDVSVVNEVAGLGLGDIVHFHDWVEPECAQKMMRQADLLLLLARAQPLQVPNKLFDYLGSRVPILGIVDAGGESERMLNAAGGQYVVPVRQGGIDPEDAIREVLERALKAGAVSPPTADEAVLREWSSAVQMERLAAVIGA